MERPDDGLGRERDVNTYGYTIAKDNAHVILGNVYTGHHPSAIDQAEEARKGNLTLLSNIIDSEKKGSSL